MIEEAYIAPSHLQLYYLLALITLFPHYLQSLHFLIKGCKDRILLSIGFQVRQLKNHLTCGVPILLHFLISLELQIKIMENNKYAFSYNRFS